HGPRSASAALVYCSSQERMADAALSYLRGLAPDRLTYVAALERLARRYGVLDENAGALSTLRELLRLGPVNDDRLEDARQLHTVLRAREDYSAIDQDIALLTEFLDRYSGAARVTGSQRGRLREEFEVYSRDLLT